MNAASHYTEPHQNSADYQEITWNVASNLSQMSALCGRIGLSKTAEILNRRRERLLNHTFSVGIVGESRRGKSTLMNVLLESSIMPICVRSTTAVICA